MSFYILVFSQNLFDPLQSLENVRVPINSNKPPNFGIFPSFVNPNNNSNNNFFGPYLTPVFHSQFLQHMMNAFKTNNNKAQPSSPILPDINNEGFLCLF